MPLEPISEERGDGESLGTPVEIGLVKVLGQQWETSEGSGETIRESTKRKGHLRLSMIRLQGAQKI